MALIAAAAILIIVAGFVLAVEPQVNRVRVGLIVLILGTAICVAVAVVTLTNL